MGYPDLLEFIMLQVSADKVLHVVEGTISIVLTNLLAILVQEYGRKTIHLHKENLLYYHRIISIILCWKVVIFVSLKNLSEMCEKLYR